MMRLFIGVGLPQMARDVLFTAASGLGVRGRMTAKENYHLTLAFLGEHDERLQVPHSIITAAAETCEPFRLSVAEFGYFGRRNSAILYAGICPSRSLQSLADTVRKRLSEAGEPYDPKPFAAHITLMRQADLTAVDLHIPLPPVEFMVDTITLYHSARVQGILRYRPVREAALGKGEPGT